MPACVFRPLRRRLAACRPWLAAGALLPLSLVIASCSTESADGGGNTVNKSRPAAAPPGATNSGGGTAATADFETPRKADGDILIKIVTNGISPFWDPMGVGMNKAKDEVGCNAEWSGPRDATVVEQKRMVEEALAKGADGIALSCIEAEASKPIIDMVLEKKIPLITFDSDSPGSRRLCYIGTNNVNAGKAAGEAAGQLLPSGGKFVGFVGNISAQNARERRQGFEEAAKPYKIDLLDVMDDGKDPARGRSNVENAISKHGSEIQGLLGLFSYNGPAIAEAVTSANLRDKYKVVCFDAEPATLLALEKGSVDATVVQKPYQFGYLSTKLLYLINRKGWSAAAKEMNIPADGIYDTGVEVITPPGSKISGKGMDVKDVKTYKKDLEKLGITSS